MSRGAVAAVVAALVLCGATPVRADIPPPDPKPADELACIGKAANDACTYGVPAKSGVCVAGTCPNGYGGTTACLRCTIDAPKDAGPADAGAADAGTAAAEDEGGCALGASRAGSWALAATPAVVLALLRLRRRRR